MNKQQAIDSAKYMFTQWRAERDRLDELDKWLRGKQDLPPSPRRATSEHRMLRELSRTPWLGLVVVVLAQTLYVDGYRSPHTPATEDDNPDVGPPSPYDIFLGNNLDARQVPIHRTALGMGYTYSRILPGKAPDGRKMAVIRGVSPRNAYAAWQDPAEDDWPMLTLEVSRQPSGDYALALFDEAQRYRLTGDSPGTQVTFIDAAAHDAGFCPFARCANQLDLDGRTVSEIEPLIPVARRIDKTVYDRLLAQHFTSWKVRTIAGLAEPDPPEGLTADQLAAWQANWDRSEKLRLSQEDILASPDPNTKFGTLDATSLDGFNTAHESDLESLSAASQMARQNFGQMVNMPAEAFTAAETMQLRRRNERQRMFTKFWNQTLRAAAGLSDNPVAAADYQAHVTWADTESRSLTQAADALGKLATQLDIPPEALWERIPGVTDTDIARFKEIAKSRDGGMGDFAAQMEKILAAQRAIQPPPAA